MNQFFDFDNLPKIEDVQEFLKGYEATIREPYTHLSENSLSEQIDLLLMAFNHWFRVPKEKFAIVQEIMQIELNSVLISDDIKDEALQRRGRLPSYMIYGPKRTFIAVQYMRLKSLEKMLEFDQIKAVKAFAKYAVPGAKFVAIEDCMKDKGLCPSLTENLTVSTWIYATFVLGHLVLLQSLSTRSENFERFGSLLGYYVQVRDDYRDLFMPESFYEKKTFGGDISEGKFRLPAVHAVSVMKSQEVYDIFMSKPSDIETKKKCVAIMEKLGSKEFCREILTLLDKEIRAEMQKIERNPYLECALDLMKDWK